MRPKTPAGTRTDDPEHGFGDEEFDINDPMLGDLSKLLGYSEERLTPQQIDFDDCSPQELLMVRALINQRLKVCGIQGIDLEEEFLIQLSWARGLQKRLAGPTFKANEQAAALMASNNALKEISRLRDDIYNSEMVRRMEKCLLDVMRAQPPEIRDAFMEKYRSAIGEVKR
jgi:hypothetical protein